MASEFVAPGSLPPHSISANVDVEAVQRLNHTEKFEVKGLVIVRRDVSFPVRLTARSTLTVTSATLVYEEGKHEVSLQVGEVNSRRLGTTLQVSVVYSCG